MELIIGDYRIRSDERYYAVDERKVAGAKAKTPGVEKWGDTRYPTTLSNACRMVLQAEINKSDACDLGQVIAAIERAERSILAALDQVTP